MQNKDIRSIHITLDNGTLISVRLDKIHSQMSANVMTAGPEKNTPGRRGVAVREASVCRGAKLKILKPPYITQHSIVLRGLRRVPLIRSLLHRETAASRTVNGRYFQSARPGYGDPNYVPNATQFTPGMLNSF